MMPTREALRHATGGVHERLHHVPVFLRLAEGTITRDAYLALLQRLFGFHDAVEQHLRDAPAIDGIDLDARQRSALILADIESLDGDAPPPGFAPLPVLDGPAQALGCLYVAEGSTLGGRHLARQLDHLLPAGEVAGRSFLLGYGARHAAMWQACCVAIEAYGAEPGQRTEMIAGANATFEAFEAWFQDT